MTSAALWRAGLSRRRFLVGSAGALGGLVAGSSIGVRPARAAAGVGPAGYTDVSMAMHVHMSFSEGAGSYDAQLAEAARAGIDVLWPSEHDWRMSALDYVPRLRFLTNESYDGRKVTYASVTAGSLKLSGGGLGATPRSPNDPDGGALRAYAVSSGTAPASKRFSVSSTNSTLKANLTGQRISLDVRPELIGPNAWLEVLLKLSYHPAQAGRPAGQYSLSYRLGTAPRKVSKAGLQGIITVPVRSGEWTSIVLDPVADIAAVWPDLLAPGDNNLSGLLFGATSRKSARAEGVFANVRFERNQTSGDVPLRVQDGLFVAYAAAYPDVTVHRSLEVSYYSDHSNWFGGNFSLIDYSTAPEADFTTWATAQQHLKGGLASLNHPLGGSAPALGQDAMLTKRRNVAKALLARSTPVSGVDILETGYRQKGGVDLETHLALWDTMSRNGILLAGTGVSDNHGGTAGSWTSEANRFATHVWVADDTFARTEPALIEALAARRVFCRELGGYAGQIWLEAAGDPTVGELAPVPMGGTSTSGLDGRSLSITCSGIPSGGQVNVVTGPVDKPGASDPNPGTAVTRAFQAGDFSVDDSVELAIDTRRSTFARIDVLNGSGRRVAFSNPIWLLRDSLIS